MNPPRETVQCIRVSHFTDAGNVLYAFHYGTGNGDEEIWVAVDNGYRARFAGRRSQTFGPRDVGGWCAEWHGTPTGSDEPGDFAWYIAQARRDAVLRSQAFKADLAVHGGVA